MGLLRWFYKEMKTTLVMQKYSSCIHMQVNDVFFALKFYGSIPELGQQRFGFGVSGLAFRGFQPETLNPKPETVYSTLVIFKMLVAKCK
jgi:hypothetical protein